MGERFGPYEVIRRLGQGGMGVVDEARHVETGASYALKRLTRHGASDPEARARFVREARALASLDHPNVVRVHAAELDGPAPYLIQPLLAGSLADRLRGGPLPLADARAIVAKLAAGLEHAHKHGVLHRDLKPDNVLLGDDGHPQLADFGLAFLEEADSRLTQTGEIMGTPVYMAPEQANDAKTADERADVYGLGAILYTMLTGRPPFESQGKGVLSLLSRIQDEPPVPVRRLRPDAPRELAALCERALAKRPEQRPASAAAFAAELHTGPPTPRWRLPAAAVFLFGGLLAAAIVTIPSGDLPAPDTPPITPRPPVDSPPIDSAKPSREPGPVRVIPLLTGALRDTSSGPPRACFFGERLLVWVPSKRAVFETNRLVRDPLRRATDMPSLPSHPTCFRRQGDLTVYGSHRQRLLWSRGTELQRRRLGHVNAIAVGPKRFAVTSNGPKGALFIFEDGPAGLSEQIQVELPYGRSVAFLGSDLLVTSSDEERESDDDRRSHSNVLEGVLKAWRWVGSSWEQIPDELRTHAAGINDIAAHPNDPTLLAFGDGVGALREVHLTGGGFGEPVDYVGPEPTSPSETMLKSRAHPTFSVRGVAYLLGGRLLLSVAHLEGDATLAVRYWDTVTRKPLFDWTETAHKVHRSVHVSEDGTQAVFSTSEQAYLITGEPERPLPPRLKVTRLLTTNPVGPPAACFVGGEAWVWDRPQRLLRISPGGDVRPVSLEELPAEHLTSGFVARIRRTTFFSLWDRPGRPLLWKVDSGPAGAISGTEISDLAFHGDTMALADYERGHVRLFDLGADGVPQERHEPLALGAARELTFSLDGDTLYGIGLGLGSLSGPRGRLQAWRRGPEGWTPSAGRGLDSNPRSLDLHPGGKHLLVGMENGELLELDASTLVPGKRFGAAQPLGKIRGVAYLHYGATLLAVSEQRIRTGRTEGSFTWWSRASGQLIESVPIPGRPRRYSLVASADQRQALFTTGQQAFLVTGRE